MTNSKFIHNEYIFIYSLFLSVIGIRILLILMHNITLNRSIGKHFFINLKHER